ncbi:Mpo1 family 2-hydroxy fatty acid dioxygenase [Sphingobium cloacae]|uniref:DUF962 domain-containing protein n=1 Tax=Sphingobium cloacae TaxID=120107 RepID=A0A1E1F359_9SPHN|nr:Mpo1-like protein [Sphingobium cloacae]BAV64946.1 hypothetical protein SCLO_1019060 [Sphingobium cloacae]
MSRLVHHLTLYAAYHRHPHNVATHMVGIPMIVMGVDILLSRPVLPADPIPLTPAIAISTLAAFYYLRLDAMLGAIMTALLAVGCWVGLEAARMPTGPWLAAGGGLFVAGWALQLVGHGYEGRKPAFLDDMRGLIIGPLFIVAEIVFALGARRAVRQAVEKRLAKPAERRLPQ